MVEITGRLSRRDLLKFGVGIVAGATFGYGIANQAEKSDEVHNEEYITKFDMELFYKLVDDYLSKDQNKQLQRVVFDAAQPVTGKKAREMFHKSQGTNDLQTTNVLDLSYYPKKPSLENSPMRISIYEPDGFKQQSTNVFMRFSYSEVLNIDDLKANAMNFFKVPQEVADAEWKSFDLKMNGRQGQYKKVIDSTGNIWILEATEFTKYEADENHNEVHHSSVKLIREYPVTDPIPHYFIPTPIVR